MHIVGKQTESWEYQWKLNALLVFFSLQDEMKHLSLTFISLKGWHFLGQPLISGQLSFICIMIHEFIQPFYITTVKLFSSSLYVLTCCFNFVLFFSPSFFVCFFTAIEVNLQKALAEASETCTQECLILGHSDSCWMPPALAQFQGPGSNSPISTPTTTAITAALPSFGFQQSCARGIKANMGSMGVMDGRHTLGRSVPKKDELDKGINRPQFYNTLDRHCSKKEDPIKVIPLASFSSPGQQTGGGGSSFLRENQL